MLELVDKHPTFLTLTRQDLGVLCTASHQGWALVTHGRGLLINVPPTDFPTPPISLPHFLTLLPEKTPYPNPYFWVFS